MKFLIGLALLALLAPALVHAQDDDDIELPDTSAPKVNNKIGSDTTTQTDSDTIQREAEAIKLDGLSAAETKLLREAAEKFEFQAEVNRMMQLIINSLYKNKEIFLRELISNASDALDKIRLLSLTDKGQLGTTPDLAIKIHADKENRVLHITDTGVGMTKAELVKNLGTIAKSGTGEFFSALQEKGADTSNLIGQFGVGFYSAFLVADRVVVTSKHNDDIQHIWESDASSFSVIADPRSDEQLGRGTRVSLYLKEEAQDYLEPTKLKDLIKKYSEFISFDIYLYTSKLVEEEEEVETEPEDETEETADSEDETTEEETEEEAEEEETEKATRKVNKTVWDWELLNANKPIWTRSPKDIEEEEYNKFYKAFSRDTKDPLATSHFTVEGEVVFRSILFVPSEAPKTLYHEYGKNQQNLKLYVRRVFITDEFDDLVPKYLQFLRGVVDSDDLPLNVSRETLQQHKLLKVIKKKLVRKALEMIKKLEGDDAKNFWKEYGTAMKLGLVEDHNNRNRISKILQFDSSATKDGETTTLDGYVERMKKDQANIYFMAAGSKEEAASSPFVERLLKRGYEVLYMTEPVDEYCIQNLPEFEGKKFQNVAKEGLKLDEGEKTKQYQEELEKKFEPLTKWMNDNLKEEIEKATVSHRLTDSPCALVANQYGWSANMERVMKAQAYSRPGSGDNDHYLTQKKVLEINPRHPLVKKLLTLVQEDEDKEVKENDQTAKDLSLVLLDTARLRSGYTLKDSVSFAQRIERMVRSSVGVSLDETVEAEPIFEEDTETAAEGEEEVDADAEGEAEEAAEEQVHAAQEEHAKDEL